MTRQKQDMQEARKNLVSFLYSRVTTLVDTPLIISILNSNLRYANLIGDIDKLKLVAQYKGEVIDTLMRNNPYGARVHFKLPSNQERIQVFPKRRLEAIGAAFETAEIEYSVYEIGANSLSVLRYIGPPPEELLNKPFAELSDEVLEELEKEEWRGYEH